MTGRNVAHWKLGQAKMFMHSSRVARPVAGSPNDLRQPIRSQPVSFRNARRRHRFVRRRAEAKEHAMHTRDERSEQLLSRQLAWEADQLRQQARRMQHPKDRDDLLARAAQIEAALGWAASPGLRQPSSAGDAVAAADTAK
jgi:hypothetical protein